MTSLVRLAKRAGGLDVAAFQRAAVRTCDWSGAVPYGLRSATQALTLESGYRRGEPVYDVVDELAFDDEAAAERCLADPVARLATQGELLDPSSITWLTVDLHVAKRGAIPATYVKNYEIVTKRPDLDRAAFDRYWIEVHGPLAAQIPTIRRYVQAHLAPRLRDSGTAPFDGLAITWWDDVDGMRAGARSDAYPRTRADERNFLAGELPFIITTERVTYPAQTT
jgi:uncharacterized protein (TIGR02118 family)